MRLCSFIYHRCEASRQSNGTEIFIIYESVMFSKFHHLLPALNTHIHTADTETRAELLRAVHTRALLPHDE